MVTLTVITGPMFSGKSEELIRRLRRAIYGQKSILAVKPKIDTRSPNISSRIKRKNGEFEHFETYAEFECYSVQTARDIEILIEDFFRGKVDVLAMDEAQFFGPWIIDFIDNLLKNYKKNLEVIVTGLDMDYAGKPFGSMPQLMALATEVVKETSICFSCKDKPGTMTQKKAVGSGEQIEVGDAELYESRCRECWTMPV
jgi:thymidine kinase